MMRILAVAAVLMVMACGVSHAEGFGNLEVSAVKPFIPATIDFAGGLSLQLGTTGQNLGHRKVFADALISTNADDRTYAGLSVSLHRAEIDDGWRFGMEVAGSRPFSTFYLRTAAAF